MIPGTKVQQLNKFGESFMSILLLFTKYTDFTQYIHLFPVTIDGESEYHFFEDDFSQKCISFQSLSTSKTGIVATGGLNPMKNFVSHNQI